MRKKVESYFVHPHQVENFLDDKSAMCTVNHQGFGDVDHYFCQTSYYNHVVVFSPGGEKANSQVRCVGRRHNPNLTNFCSFKEYVKSTTNQGV